MLEPITISCRFCDGKYLPDEIPILGNIDTRRSVCIIAQGADKKQIVLNANGKCYGIDIDYCPFCGRKLPVKGWR